MKCQRTISLLILTGTRMRWHDKIPKRPVCKMSSIRLGHRWSDLTNTSPIFHRFTYLQFISQFTYSNVLHFDSNNSLDRSNLAPQWKKKSAVYCIYIMCIYFYQLFYHSWAICLQEHGYQIIIILASSAYEHTHTCSHRHGRKKWRCVWDQTHTHNSLVSSADVYIPSSQYNTDELIALEAPSLLLISIISPHIHTRTHTHTQREREVYLHKSHNISIPACLWGIR